jgi:hypothetical protein
VLREFSAVGEDDLAFSDFIRAAVHQQPIKLW